MNPIEIEHLSRRYGRLEAVVDLNLSVPRGSICALLGPNGAGKTTTLRMMAGLLAPDHGSVRLLGTEARRLGVAERRRIGYLDEAQQQPEWLTVAGFLAYCRPLYPNWDRALEADLLRRFDLPLDRKLSQLSRGMRMKALLVSVTAFRPELLILDEPFSGLDPVVRDDVTKGLLEVAQSGECTVFLSSHDIDEVERIADRIVMIDHGRLLLDEPVDALLARHRRILVDLQGGGELVSAGLPSAWGPVSREGDHVEFVDTAYEAAACETACRARFPQALVRAHPMSLREIYLFRARQLAGMGSSAS